MNEPSHPENRGPSLTLFGLAAIIAAVAGLLLAAAVLIVAVGWWQGRQVSVDSVISQLDGGADANGSAAVVTLKEEDGDVVSATTVPAAPLAPAPALATAVPAAPAGAGTPQAPAVVVPGADVVAVVENWQALSDTASVEAAIERNLGAGATNTMTLALLDPWAAPGGQGGLAIDYWIGEEAPDDFVGFNRSLASAQDWREATHLGVWADPGSTSIVELVVQFKEASGEVWRYQGPAGDIPVDGLLLLPLDASTFTWADWSTTENGEIDLAAINQYGVYIGHVGPGVVGTLSIGALAAVRQ